MATLDSISEPMVIAQGDLDPASDAPAAAETPAPPVATEPATSPVENPGDTYEVSAADPLFASNLAHPDPSGAPMCVAPGDLSTIPARSSAELARAFEIEDYDEIQARLAEHGLELDTALVGLDRFITAELESAGPAPDDWDAIVAGIRANMGNRIEEIAASVEPPDPDAPDPRWDINGELLDAFDEAAPILFSAAAYRLLETDAGFNDEIDARGPRVAPIYRMRIEDGANALRRMTERDDADTPSGLLGNPWMFHPGANDIRGQAFSIAGMHPDLLPFRGNPVRGWAFEPESPIEGVTFLSSEDQRIEEEAMLYYLAAAGLQSAPYVGAAPSLAVDARDIFSSHNATIIYLKEAGLIDPRYHREKAAWEYVAAGAGVALTAFGAQGAARLPRVSRIMSRLRPGALSRLPVITRNLNRRIFGADLRPDEALEFGSTVRRLGEASGIPTGDLTREIFPQLHRLRPADASLLRSVESRLDAGERIDPTETARVRDVFERLFRADGRPRATISPDTLAENPEILRGLDPGEVRGFLNTDNAGFWRGEPWSYRDPESGLSLSWTPEVGWSHRVGDEVTEIPAEAARSPIVVRTDRAVPDELAARVEETGLPILEGSLPTRGSRSQRMTLDTRLHGYARFESADGRRLFSMRPIDGDAFDALAMIRRFEEQTGRTDVMARPVGIHVFNGQPRLVFEDLGSTRVPGSWSAMSADQRAFFESLLSPQHLARVRANGVDSAGRTLETDYIFQLPDGSIRLGVPVRVNGFAAVIDDFFR